jgi:calcium-dependent protein kinase
LDHYRLGPLIGDPTTSRVRIAFHKKTETQKAVKIFDKKTIPNLDAYIDHVHLLDHIEHPNILKYEEVYEDKTYLYFVSDYMKGGELYDAIVNRGNYNEHDAATVIRQLLLSVAYLHSEGMVNRNIRPGNILLQNPKSLDLKVIDYDFAAIRPAGKLHFTPEGLNPVYEAPEVLNGNYDEKCDIWSIGVLFYYLLSGDLPFWGPTNDVVIEKVLRGKFDWESDIWWDVSDEAKQLIHLMLTYNSANRISAVDALRHPFFNILKKGHYKQPKDLSKALTNIYQFNAGTKLKQAVLAFFTKNLLSQQEMAEITDQFQAIDKNNNGKLSRDEIKDAYRLIKGIDFNEQEIDDLITNIDADGSGEIDYNEWMMTAVSKEKLLSQEKLEQAFALFDTNNDKSLSYSEVTNLLQGVKNVNPKAVERAVRDLDFSSGNGQLTFKEFKALIEKLFDD